jgi:hypothetical protein
MPVVKTRTPTQPHVPIVPVIANPIKAKPVTILKIRSAPPILNFIIGSLVLFKLKLA